ncbi:(R)-specific enoyl-CoA hydratase [Actinidia chinensis var. chinensis]|uniref:(R)-specific enoyl-CoA hydratase n=1 Tax=Actinidia chinensis var. chinensis TaxID=1590841 RepID=A0A2R6QSD2_ACTCC|nr:(R)-specific enoyl-CoA hydratase [Actinidia chinensis var. chinensis]
MPRMLDLKTDSFLGCLLLPCFRGSLLLIFLELSTFHKACSSDHRYILGEVIIGEVQATNIRAIKNQYLAQFKMKCFKQGDHVVIHGEATAILPTLAKEQGQSMG